MCRTWEISWVRFLLFLVCSPQMVKMCHVLIDNTNWLLRAESKRLWLLHKASMSKSGKNAIDKEIIISLLRHTWEPLVQAVSFLEHWTARAACWLQETVSLSFPSVTESAHVGGFSAKCQGGRLKIRWHRSCPSPHPEGWYSKGVSGIGAAVLPVLAMSLHWNSL